MGKDAVFTMKVEPELRDAFFAAAAAYEAYARRKVEVARGEMRAGEGDDGADVAGAFAVLRGMVGGNEGEGLIAIFDKSRSC